MNGEIMKRLQILLLPILLTGLASCQLVDEVEEVFPGFVLEEGKLYEVNGKTPYTGTITQHYEDGTLKMEAEYVEGEQKSAIYYYENGNKQSEVIRREEDSLMTLWYESGQKEEEIKPGTIRQWYENGQLKALVSIDDFRNYHGDMKMWDEDGNLIAHEVYEDGELVETVSIDE